MSDEAQTEETGDSTGTEAATPKKKTVSGFEIGVKVLCEGDGETAVDRTLSSARKIDEVMAVLAKIDGIHITDSSEPKHAVRKVEIAPAA